MRNATTREDAIVTFEKSLGPGVFVHVAGIPAKVVRYDDAAKDDLTLVDRQTGGKLLDLLRAARGRMARGETDIHLDFRDDA
jgi:hypothetical protein